jgi:lysophospholipase
MRLHALHWPVERRRAVLLVSHGLGEHGGRYAALARDLAQRGVEVHALDHRGHGRSAGVRAYVPRFSRFVDDFEAFHQQVAAGAGGGLPVFVLGHSLGGLIAIRWLEAHPGAGLAGAVLSAPLLGVKKEAARWKLALAGALSKLLPWLPLGNEIDPAELSSDPAYVRSYREDPLVHARITPRLYTEMTAAMGDAVAERQRLALPLLFLVPGADSIVREEETLRFAAGLTGDVTVRRYPGFRHESLNELDRARPVADVARWIDAKIAHGTEVA